MDLDDIPITEEQGYGRFVLKVPDGPEAELVYRVEGTVMTLLHTGVPDEFGGRGIGGRLVQAALARAGKTSETIAPWCPYVRKWIEDHPDHIVGISLDWTEPPLDA